MRAPTLKAERVAQLREFLAKRRQASREELANHFTAREIDSAVETGVILDDGTGTFRSSEIDPELFGRVAAATAVPRSPPIQSADGQMFFWRLKGGLIEPFAVKRTASGGFCLVLTERGRVPKAQSAQCWQEGEVEYAPESFQQALIDAWDANKGFAEGLYQVEQPWRHPQTDRPLALRKP